MHDRRKVLIPTKCQLSAGISTSLIFRTNGKKGGGSFLFVLYLRVGQVGIGYTGLGNRRVRG